LNAIQANDGTPLFFHLYTLVAVGENVVIFKSPQTILENIDTTLFSVMDAVAAEGRIATRCDRYARVPVREDVVIFKDP